MKLNLKARVNRSDARTIRHALEQLAGKGSVTKTGDEFVVEAEMEGASAKVSFATMQNVPGKASLKRFPILRCGQPPGVDVLAAARSRRMV
jgi:hypothetical protein